MTIVEPKKFKLEFSNRVIEHLGIKLYQNKPTNVIAEFVSNAWDADASNVDVDLRSSRDCGPEIIITDNGRGMSRSELTDHFLVIGRNRREHPTDKTPMNRLLMGRKGIGKLAGFGIARTVDIISCPNPGLRNDPTVDKKIFWLRFHLSDLVQEDLHIAKGEYYPEVIADGLDLPQVLQLPQLIGNASFLDLFSTYFNQNLGGTCVRLTETTLKRAVNPDQLLRSMGQRFTVSMLRTDFSVKVNGKSVEPKLALPQFYQFGFGSIEEPISESVEICGEKKEIRYWAKFVSLQDSEWPLENGGVGIYAHGKIAQDRPFFFEVKGKEIFSRYLYAVIDADWLDELEHDVVSTDRRSIDWNTDATEALHAWGASKVSAWIEAFKKWRQQQPKREIISRIRGQTPTSTLTAPEEDALANLLSEVLPSLGNNEEAKDKTTLSFTEAWTHAPTRKLTKSLWESVFQNGDIDSAHFVELVERLKKSLVPEAMGLAVTMAQRIAAITAMWKLVTYGKTETHLQRLIEEFPWLLGPKWEILTANQTIRTLIKDMHKPDESLGEWAINDSGARLKPDFVFLSDAIPKEIVVIELKGPEGEKTLQPGEYTQLVNYLNIIERAFPNSGETIRGVLIGHEKGGFRVHDQRVEVRTWNDVMLDARALHVSYLQALLVASNPQETDARIRQICDFGGKETVELIQRMGKEAGLSLPETVKKALTLNLSPVDI